MAFPGIKGGPRAPTKVLAPGRVSNLNRDESTVSRAPRLKPLSTRDYAKKELPAEQLPKFGGNTPFGG